MKKANKIFEILYLIIAVFFFIETIRTFSTNTNKALLLGAFAVMAIFMFFLKRKIRKRNYTNQKPNK